LSPTPSLDLRLSCRARRLSWEGMGTQLERTPSSDTLGVWTVELARRHTSARRIAFMLAVLGIPGTLTAIFRTDDELVALVMVTATLGFGGLWALGYTKHRRLVAPLVLVLMLGQHIASEALTPPEMMSP